jgi:ACS family D-galactonate transporter-like MFS transporter
VSALVTKHATPLKTLLALDDKTAAALTKDPTDPAALPTALKEVAQSQGASAALADQVEAIAKSRSDELATASAIDSATLATLQKTPTDAAAIAKAQGEIASAFKITPTAALTRLLGLSSAAVQKDLAVVTPYATALQTASAAIPAADLAQINKYGAVLKGAQAGIPADALAKLQKAKHDTPMQWQHWWWVCFIAQIVFLPFVFLLTGHWSSRRARKDEQDHEEMIAREMEALGITQ